MTLKRKTSIKQLHIAIFQRLKFLFEEKYPNLKKMSKKHLLTYYETFNTNPKNLFYHVFSTPVSRGKKGARGKEQLLTYGKGSLRCLDDLRTIYGSYANFRIEVVFARLPKWLRAAILVKFNNCYRLLSEKNSICYSDNILRVKERNSIYDCFRLMTTEEKLDKENLFKCDSCLEKVQATKKL